jgi:hypothetical protein
MYTFMDPTITEEAKVISHPQNHIMSTGQQNRPRNSQNRCQLRNAVP